MSDQSDKTKIDHETEVSPPSCNLHEDEIAAALFVAERQNKAGWQPVRPMFVQIKRSSGTLETWILVGQSKDGKKFVSRNADGSLLHYDERSSLGVLNPDITLPNASVPNLTINVNKLLGEEDPKKDN